MRWRLVAIVSVGLNLALLAGLLAARRASAPTPAPGGATQAAGTNIYARTVPIFSPGKFLSWEEIESPDYRKFIANLRLIKCPEQTIRDIIIADVNAMFARRLAIELVNSTQQWWRTEPDPEIDAEAAAKAHALDEERRQLLTSLLGPNWETGDLANLPRPSKAGVVLDGPILGTLPAETRQAIQEVNLRSEERLAAYIERVRAEGREPDAVELARLRQQTREDLARVLTPPQLEEYLLRYSQTANDLRLGLGALKFFNATPDEFRSVFRSIDQIQERLALLGEGTDPNTVQARQSLEAQRENAIRIALGNRRYEEYRNLQDPDYRDAMAQAQEAGTPEAVRGIYNIILAAKAEEARIIANTNLTAEQRNIQLKQLELEQLQASAVAKGEELPPEPPAPPAPPQKRTYTIRPGDNLSVVAMIHGVPMSAIRAANPNVDLNRIRPGDVLTIPRTSVPPPLPP